MPGRVLTLDPGMSCGWAYGQVLDLHPACGTERPRGVDVAPFLISFSDWFAALLDHVEPDEVIVEGGTPPQTFKQVDVAKKMVGMEVFANVICRRRRIPFSTVHVMTARKFVTGSGKADDAMVNYAVVSLGASPDTGHAADAALLWFWHAKRRIAAHRKRPGRLIA